MIPSCPPPQPRNGPSLRAATPLLGTLALALAACTTTPEAPVPEATGRNAAELRAAATLRRAAASARRADRARIEHLEREIERLRMDLQRAESAMTATDSEVGSVSSGNRARAVSMLVEARIALEQAEASVSWQPSALEEGRRNLLEGERQLKVGRTPAAAYFGSRAQHIAASLIAQAHSVEESPNTRFVRADQLNLRAGPSTRETVLAVLPMGTPVFSKRTRKEWVQVRTLGGTLGWVYASLLSEP